MAKDDRDSKSPTGITYRRRIGPDGKSYNFNVPPEVKKPAAVAKPAPKAEAKPATPKADAAPKVDVAKPKPLEPSKRGQEQRFRPAGAGASERVSTGPVPRNAKENATAAMMKKAREETDAVLGFLPAHKLIANAGKNRLLRTAYQKLDSYTEGLNRLGEPIRKRLGIKGPEPLRLPSQKKPSGPTTPNRITGPEKPKLLEYKPQPKARATPKPKPKKPNPEQGSLNYKSGGRIDGAAVRGKTKGRYC
jgi:hypothetical protein